MLTRPEFSCKGHGFKFFDGRACIGRVCGATHTREIWPRQYLRKSSRLTIPKQTVKSTAQIIDAVVCTRHYIIPFGRVPNMTVFTFSPRRRALPDWKFQHMPHLWCGVLLRAPNDAHWLDMCIIGKCSKSSTLDAAQTSFQMVRIQLRVHLYHRADDVCALVPCVFGATPQLMD